MSGVLHDLPRRPSASVPPGFVELTEAIGFAAANGPWFEKIEDGRLVRGFLAGPQHANSLGIVHGGMMAAFLDSAMGSTVWHVLQRRAVTLKLSLDYLGPGRIGEWLQADAEVMGEDEHAVQVRDEFHHLLREILGGVVAAAGGRTHHGLRGAHVAAGGAADAEIDAAGKQGFEHAELLGHLEG